MGNNRSLIMAKRLKELREEKKLSHVSLSKALKEQYNIDISRDSLMSYEVSDPNHAKAYKNEGMRIEYLRCLAEFYNVSSDYLLGLTNNPSRKPSAVDDLGLSPKAVRSLKTISDPRQGYSNMIKGLNELLESNGFYHILIAIPEYKIAVENEINSAMTEYAELDSLDSSSEIPSEAPDEREILEKYPEMKGRIVLLHRDDAIDFNRMQLERRFGNVLNSISGYKELQEIKQKIGDELGKY